MFKTAWDCERHLMAFILPIECSNEKNVGYKYLKYWFSLSLRTWSCSWCPNKSFLKGNWKHSCLCGRSTVSINAFRSFEGDFKNLFSKSLYELGVVVRWHAHILIIFPIQSAFPIATRYIRDMVPFRKVAPLVTWIVVKRWTSQNPYYVTVFSFPLRNGSRLL